MLIYLDAEYMNTMDHLGNNWAIKFFLADSSAKQDYLNITF